MEQKSIVPHKTSLHAKFQGFSFIGGHLTELFVGVRSLCSPPFNSDQHEETSAIDDDKMKKSKDSIVLPNNVKSIENENNVELGGDYEHWFNLWKEMFCSEGWEGSPEGRLKYKYVMKKLGEAKKVGYAKEEKKDYNYWWELWREKFAGDESGEKFLEEVKFIVQKMKDTKQETN